MRLIIEYPEQVQCNLCGKMIKPDKESWAIVYLLEGYGGVAYPRCEDCEDKTDEDIAP